MAGKIKYDMTGKTIGRWSVLRREGSDKASKPQWLCRCECGIERIVLTQRLLNGESKSCGCYGRELVTKRARIHGDTANGTKSTRYQLYLRAKDRAATKKLPCDIRFLDMPLMPDVCPVLGIPLIVNKGNFGPKSGSPSLDRIDNSEGYVKGNLRIISHRANTLKRDASSDELALVLNDLQRTESLEVDGYALS